MTNTVVTKGGGIRKERQANAAITPGHLVEVMSTGKLRVHATAGGNAQKAIAVENEVFGDGIDVAYAANDQVLYEVLQRGSEFQALIAAGAAAIVIGDFLESAGDGTLRKHVDSSQAVNEGGSATYTIAQHPANIVAVAIVAVDNSGGGTAVRLRAEVI